MNLLDLPSQTNMWTEQDRALYNKLPLYLQKRTIEYIKEYDFWGKLMEMDPWVANVGTSMTGVNKVPAPTLRGQFLPNPITQEPNHDVVEVRETKESVQLYRFQMESNIFHFLPSFQDFLTDSIDVTSENISDKIVINKDLFYRTAYLHGSPFMWICGKNDGTPELTTVPYWTAPTVSLIKTQAFWQAMIAKVGGGASGGLDLRQIKKLGVVLDTDLRALPYSGKQLPDGTDGSALQQKFCLGLSSEVWMGFTDDGPGSYLLENKALDLDIVTNRFRGSLFGMFTTRHECREARLTLDGRIVGPDTVEENPDAYDFGDTVPNPEWVNAPFGIAWAIGSQTWKCKRVGPPPKYFADGAKGMTLNQFNGMDWSGKVHLTRNILIAQADGSLKTNMYGDRAKLISDVTCGTSPLRRRNLVPILYRRTRISTT